LKLTVDRNRARRARFGMVILPHISAMTQFSRCQRAILGKQIASRTLLSSLKRREAMTSKGISSGKAEAAVTFK
jgi:hypothetical protein